MNKYKELSAFINLGHERIFNDNLMRIIITEIRLKSYDLNTDMLLPTYFLSDTNYYGETYRYTASIASKLSKKALKQAINLCLEGASQDLKDISEIKAWISQETNINDCSLSALL